MFKNQRYLCAIAIGVATASAHAATLQVPSASYPNLPIAINAAVSGDEIVLAAGSYLAVPGFVISNKQLTLRGATGDPDDVILDGFSVMDNPILTISGSASSGSRIEGMTILNGLNSTSGAGVLGIDTDLEVHNCIIRDNRVTDHEADAPAIYVNDGDLTLTESTFIGNRVGAAGDAGAVFVINGTALIEDCHFEDNGQDPGSIDTEARGGALRVDTGYLGLKRCRFENNRSGRGGALFVSQAATLYVDACEFVDNEGYKGAGMYISGSSTSRTRVVRNCLFDGNETSSADAAVFSDRPCTFTNCTFARNVAGTSYVLGGSPPAGSIIVDNCIMWDNTEGASLFPSAMSTVIRNTTMESAYSGGSGSANNTLEDPMFVNGPNGNFRLAQNSPAIDAGDSNLYFGPFADLDGNLRGVDHPSAPDTGHAIDGPIIDRGCYERQPPVQSGPTCPGDVNGDNTVNFTDLNELLENWDQDCD